MENHSLSTETVSFFREIPIFNKINIEELKIIAKHVSTMNLPKGDILFNESEKGNYICFIAQGALEVIKRTSSDEQEVVISTLKKGESIGEMSVIDDYPRSATIRAREDTRLFILSKSAFDYILEKHSRIGIKLLKGISRTLCHHLRITSSRLADYMPPIS